MTWTEHTRALGLYDPQGEPVYTCRDITGELPEPCEVPDEDDAIDPSRGTLNAVVLSFVLFWVPVILWRLTA